VTTTGAYKSTNRSTNEYASLRRVLFEDLRALESLEKEVFLDLAYSRPYLRSLYDMFRTTWYVADHDGDLAGYALVGLASNKTDAWLQALAVGNRHQRQGLGSKLMDKALITMMEAGVTDAYLTVDPRNEAASRIYERFEFTLVREEDDYYGNGEMRYVMHRSLEDNPYDGADPS